jgi:Glycosyl-4,4'-diaponeurosporenoate acyltransferase
MPALPLPCPLPALDSQIFKVSLRRFQASRQASLAFARLARACCFFSRDWTPDCGALYFDDPRRPAPGRAKVRRQSAYGESSLNSHPPIEDAKHKRAGGSDDNEFANETKGFNLIPFAVMAGGWLGPLIMFWLYVWGPLRPFDYPQGNLAPSALAFAASVAACLAVALLPSSYYRPHRLERTGRLYEAIGVRLFRNFVPDGDLSNRWRRRHDPGFRMIRNRHRAAAFVRRTVKSEKSHLVLLAMGVLSAAFALAIGWWGWAIYISAGNVLVHVYPVLLQRYTRSRIERVLSRDRRSITGRAECVQAAGPPY